MQLFDIGHAVDSFSDVNLTICLSCTNPKTGSCTHGKRCRYYHVCKDCLGALTKPFTRDKIRRCMNLKGFEHRSHI